MSVADGEIPPWLLEDDGSTQVDAGDYTPDARNQYAIPDPEATVADSGASGSADQNQPALAGLQDDDIAVETPEIPAEVNVVDPLLHNQGGIAAVPAEQVSQTEAHTTIIKKGDTAIAAAPTPPKFPILKSPPPRSLLLPKLLPTRRVAKNSRVRKVSSPKSPHLLPTKCDRVIA